MGRKWGIFKTQTIDNQLFNTKSKFLLKMGNNPLRDLSGLSG